MGVHLDGRDGPGDGESEQSGVRPGVVAAAGAAQRAGCEHAHAHPGVRERGAVFLRAGGDGGDGASGGREGDCGGVWEEGGYSVCEWGFLISFFLGLRRPLRSTPGFLLPR